MNLLSPELRPFRRRAALVATLATAATGLVLLGPPPSVAADLAHNFFGTKNTVETAVERIAADTYDITALIHCAPTGDRVGGQASLRYRTIRLNPLLCDTLGKIIADPEAVDTHNSDNAIAVLALAHELSHLEGAGLGKEGDEGVTQFLGAQRSEQVASALGIPLEKARILGESAAVAAHSPPRPEYAIPAGCTNGGQYDINAPGDHFPKDPTESFINGD